MWSVGFKQQIVAIIIFLPTFPRSQNTLKFNGNVRFLTGVSSDSVAPPPLFIMESNRSSLDTRGFFFSTSNSLSESESIAIAFALLLGLKTEDNVSLTTQKGSVLSEAILLLIKAQNRNMLCVPSVCSEVCM